MPECNSSFLRDLKNLDRNLGVKFNGRNFVITYQRAYGEPVNLHCVEDDGGGFRQPDRREIELLWKGDRARGDNPRVRLQKAAYASEVMRRQRSEKTRSEIRDMTKDSKIQLQQSFRRVINDGKANATFRRVAPKRSRNVVKVVP